MHAFCVCVCACMHIVCVCLCVCACIIVHLCILASAPQTDRPFVCDECHQSFVEACNLKRHMRSHQGLKAYVCEECGAAFTKGHHLRDHVASHKGGGIHKCDQCEAVFNNANQLRLHIKVCGDTCPYLCPLQESCRLSLKREGFTFGHFRCWLATACFSATGADRRHIGRMLK